MKKFIVLILLLVSMAICSSAREKGGNPDYKTGYLGTIGLNAGHMFGDTGSSDIITSHGKTFGNGLFVGGGIAITSLWDLDDAFYDVTIPIFGEMKYSFINGDISPFADFKLGLSVYSSNISGVGLFASPSLGVDIRRWSIFLSYSHLAFSRYKGVEFVKHMETFRHERDILQIGFSWNF